MTEGGASRYWGAPAAGWAPWAGAVDRDLSPPAPTSPAIRAASTSPAHRGQRDGGDQPGGGEHGQDLGPAHLGLADPTSRRATTSTAYSDRWLTSEVTVIEIQRWATRSTLRVVELDRGQLPTRHRPRPTSRRSRVATRPASSPNRRAARRCAAAVRPPRWRPPARRCRPGRPRPAPRFCRPGGRPGPGPAPAGRA